MAIDVSDKIVALIVSMEPNDIANLPPARRRRLADHCRHVVALAELKQPEQREQGVLADLRRGVRQE